MSAGSSDITITPFLVADLPAEDARMPVYVHVIDHPAARVLVDTGMTELHPLVADLDPRLHPPSERDLDPDAIDIVVNTHLHFDHCGGNRLMQVVVVESGRRPVVVGGDVAVSFGELDEPQTEGQRRVRALDPELVWLTHQDEPWRPAAA